MDPDSLARSVVAQGNVKFHTADILRTETTADSLRSVVLADGSCIESVDVIVNATGYQTVWPFLESEGLPEHSSENRYRYGDLARTKRWVTGSSD